MLRTYGRIMPVLMPLGAILAIALAVASRGAGGPALWLRVQDALTNRTSSNDRPSTFG